MSANADQGTELLLEVRRRRAELRSSMGALERALASPAQSGGGAPGWSGRLRDALGSLYGDFGQHVAITEGPEGLYAELAQHSPRLEHAVIRLVEEHGGSCAGSRSCSPGPTSSRVPTWSRRGAPAPSSSAYSCVTGNAAPT